MRTARQRLLALSLGLAAGIALVAFTTPAGAMIYVRSGLLFPVTSPAVLPPLIGLGVAQAGYRGRFIAALALLFVAVGIGTAEAAAFELARLPELEARLARYPIAEATLMAATGLTLLLSATLVRLAVPVTVALSSMALSAAAWLNGPGDELSTLFAIGAMLSSTVIMLVSLQIARAFEGRVLAIARPIAGSWLLAAGLMLASAALIPKKAVAPPPPDFATEPIAPFDPAKQP